MSIPDEMLMAYADGEFDRPEALTERATIEAAAIADPELARRIDEYRAQRRRLGLLYSDILQESVPERLIAAARSAPLLPAATVTDLGRARSLKQTIAAEAAATRSGRPARPWTAIAASLVIGVIAGYFAFHLYGLEPLSVRGGRVVAQASLDQALTRQLAGDRGGAEAVRVGLTFKAKSGAYCRTFVLQRPESLGGLACREDGVWAIQVLAQVEKPVGTTTSYRPAGSELPTAVRAAVEAQIVGDPLDSKEEFQAKQHNWK